MAKCTDALRDVKHMTPTPTLEGGRGADIDLKADARHRTPASTLEEGADIDHKVDARHRISTSTLEGGADIDHKLVPGAGHQSQLLKKVLILTSRWVLGHDAVQRAAMVCVRCTPGTLYPKFCHAAH